MEPPLGIAVPQRHSQAIAKERPGFLSEINHRWGRRVISTGKIAASAARLATRRVFKAEGSTDFDIGQRMAEELDEMKGLAMKVGQILSYFEGVLPDNTHEALRSLQKGVTPVAFESMGPVIQEAFGAPVDEVFEHFDRDPIASASIGQVYKAHFRGRDVAVKVQYPNVKKTFESDFSRIERLARIPSLVTAVDGVAIAKELNARILEECDYIREATYQERFTEAFSSDPDVAIPGVVWDRTQPNVITSDWKDGDDFYAFAANNDQATCTRVGQVITRFAYQSLYRFSTLNADPHPGNYLFPPGGPVVFLDFGCIRRFDEGFVDLDRTLTRVVIDDQRSSFDEALIATGMIPRPDKFDFDQHWEMMCHQLAPYRSDRFHFTKEYIREGMKYSGPTNPNLRKISIPPPWIWTQRLQWGLHAVLVRLNAEGCFRDILLEALDAPRTPIVL